MSRRGVRSGPLLQRRRLATRSRPALRPHPDRRKPQPPSGARPLPFLSRHLKDDGRLMVTYRNRWSLTVRYRRMKKQVANSGPQTLEPAGRPAPHVRTLCPSGSTVSCRPTPSAWCRRGPARYVTARCSASSSSAGWRPPLKGGQWGLSDQSPRPLSKGGNVT
jgi:hypothetical protein